MAWSDVVQDRQFVRAGAALTPALRVAAMLPAPRAGTVAGASAAAVAATMAAVTASDPSDAASSPPGAGAAATVWREALVGRVTALSLVHVPSPDDLARAHERDRADPEDDDGALDTTSASSADAAKHAAEEAVTTAARFTAAGLTPSLAGAGTALMQPSSGRFQTAAATSAGALSPEAGVGAGAAAELRDGEGSSASSVEASGAGTASARATVPSVGGRGRSGAVASPFLSAFATDPWFWEPTTLVSPADEWAELRVVPARGQTANLLAKRGKKTEAGAILDALHEDRVSAAVAALDVQVDLGAYSGFFSSTAALEGFPVLIDGQLLPFRVRRLRVSPHPDIPVVDIMRFM